METFIVYMHINKMNNKKYVGITHLKPEIRWGKDGNGYKQCPSFWNAIQKYGWNNFEHNILFAGLSKEEACDMEIKLIHDLDLTNHDNGYNLSTGGDMKDGENNPFYGHTHTEEVKEKIRESNRRRVWFEESKDKLRARKRSASQNAKRVMCVETGVIYECMKDAAEETGANLSKMSDVIHGRRKTAGGYHWKLLDDAA